jgi:DNA-binding beta-propeller fold protein YncE
MALRPVLIVSLLSLAACNDNNDSAVDPPDLTVPATQDLAVPGADLARGPDLATRDLGGGGAGGGGGEDGGSTLTIVDQLPGVTVATLAGSAVSGALDGSGGAALFNNPVGIAIDANGLLYVTEYDGSRVRTVNAAGQTGTVVADVATPNTFACPFAIAVVNATTLLVQTDCDVTGAKTNSSGTLWTVNIPSGTPTARVQQLGRPRGLAVLSVSTALVSDHVHQHIDRLTLPTGPLTSLAGAADQPGFADLTGAAARFNAPYGMAALGDGSVIVADLGNHRLRRVVAADGATSTFAGDGEPGTVDAATALGARFDAPKAVAVDAAGDVFVSDAAAHRIRRVAADGTVNTIAGDGVAGFKDGAGGEARFFGQEGLAVTPDGKNLYVADGNAGEGGPYHRIRVITIP